MNPPAVMQAGSPLVLDNQTVDWLREVIVTALFVNPPTSGTSAEMYRHSIRHTADLMAESLRENRRLIEAVVAAEKQLGQGTWTGPGSLLQLVDAAKALGRMLP